MREELLGEISKLTDEEKRILAGEELDKKFYTAENDFIINRYNQGIKRRRDEYASAMVCD